MHTRRRRRLLWCISSIEAGTETKRREVEEREKGRKKMDIPIANLMMEGLLTGYERQAKKEEKEAKAIIAGINPVLLRLKKEVEEMKKKDEQLADSRLGDLGIQPKIFLFDLNIAPFRAIMIAETSETWVTIRAMLDDIFGNVLTTIIHEKATRLREELRKRGIYGVTICDIHDQFDLPRGRTIAKGRLWKHLKQQGAKTR
jgi:hypothetical protein